MAARTPTSESQRHHRGYGDTSGLSRSHQQQDSLVQSSMAVLYEELSLLRAKYQLLVEQCNFVLKPRAVVESTKRPGPVSKVLKSSSNVVAPPLVESPQQQRDLQLLEDVLEKARRIRISQPVEQPRAVRRETRTENAVKLAEAVYKPPKKQSSSHRLPPSGSQAPTSKTTMQKHQYTSAVRKHRVPSSSSSRKKCHSHAQPPWQDSHTLSHSPLHTVSHHHLQEEVREEQQRDVDALETVVVRHTERKKEIPQLQPMPAKYQRFQRMIERTNEHLKANHDSRDDDSREDDSIAQHFFNRFTQPKAASDHTEQLIQLLIAREEHRLVAQGLSSLSPRDLIASERQSLEEVVRMRTRLEKLTAPVDPPLLHIAAHKTEEKKSSQLSYTTLELCRAVLEQRLSELWLKFETELLLFCSQHVLPQLTRMDSHDPRFISLLKATHWLCGLSPPVFVSTDIQK